MNKDSVWYSALLTVIVIVVSGIIGAILYGVKCLIDMLPVIGDITIILALFCWIWFGIHMCINGIDIEPDLGHRW